MRDQEEVQASLGARQVLVVDDHELVRQLIVEVLRSSGLDVVQADSGQSALSIVSQSKDRIGCIVQDMSMPGMSAPETISETLKVFPKAKIVVLSVDDEAMVRQELGGNKVVGYLQKPCDTDVLINTVRKVLDS